MGPIQTMGRGLVNGADSLVNLTFIIKVERIYNIKVKKNYL